MAEKKIIEFRAGPAFRNPPRKKKRPPPKTTEQIDPNVKKTGRLYEVSYHYVSAEHVITVRYRVRCEKFGIENNVYEHGGEQYYFGMIQEDVGRGKWSPPGFGCIAVKESFVREIVEEPAPPTPIRAPKKDETK